MLEILVAALLQFLPGKVSASQLAVLDETMLRKQVSAALEAERVTGVDAFTLLGMAFVESRYQPWQVSFRRCSGGVCKRAHAAVRRGVRPNGARPSFYCGVTQVGGYISWPRCVQLMRDLDTNYLEAAEHLQQWMRDPLCKRRGDNQLRCALLGNGGGYPAIRVWLRGGKHRVLSYPSRCLHTAKMLRRVATTIGRT